MYICIYVYVHIYTCISKFRATPRAVTPVKTHDPLHASVSATTQCFSIDLTTAEAAMRCSLHTGEDTRIRGSIQIKFGSPFVRVNLMKVDWALAKFNQGRKPVC